MEKSVKIDANHVGQLLLCIQNTTDSEENVGKYNGNLKAL